MRPRRLPVRTATAVSALASLLLAAPGAGAADWTFTPTLTVGETYTDNAGLNVRGAERSEFITQLRPGLLVAGEGRRLKVKAQYELQGRAYARLGDFDSSHLFDASADAELVDQLFFFNGRASVRDQAISPFNAVQDSIANPSANRTSVRTYSLSPYLQHRFGSSATAELRYTHDAVSSDASGLLDSSSNGVRLNVDSGPAFQTIGWNWQYNRTHTDYDNANSMRMESTSGTLRYRLTPRFVLTSTVGYEKNNYLSQGDAPQGSFWNIGAAWAPTSRTSLEATAGNRYYGDSYSLIAKHRTRRTAWSLGYSDQVSTTQSRFLVPATTDTAAFLDQLWQSSIPDAVDRQQVIDAFIRTSGLPAALDSSINTLTNRVFLEKRWHASVALNGARNTLLLSLYDTARTAQTSSAIDSALLGTALLGQADDTRQTGVNALWSWRPTSRTNASVSAGRARARSFTTSETSDSRTFRTALTRQFQPRVKGTLEYRHLRQNFEQSVRDVRENAVTATVSMTF